MAKNEDPDNRWAPFHIPPLLQMPELCPVTTLKRYLELTKHFSGDQLFRHETSGKQISIKNLGAKIIEFVNAADPHKKMSVHELRKIAASLNYFEFMKFSDIAKCTGWKSTRVFFKHYLKSIEDIHLLVVAAGKAVGIRNDGDAQ